MNEKLSVIGSRHSIPGFFHPFSVSEQPVPDRSPLQLWLERINRGLVYVSNLTLLELGFSARNGVDWSTALRTPPVANLMVEYLTPAMEDRAIEVQGVLAEHGHHRAPSVPDLLSAAIAELSGMTVLHVDKDFDLIAEVTQQPVERLDITAES